MSITGTLAHVKSLLDGQNVPGETDVIEAFVAPPDPEIRQGSPHAYIWTARGNHKRDSGPRSAPPPGMTPYQPISPQTSGWVVRTHQVEVYLTWFDDNEDPQADSSFPLLLDMALNILSTCQMPIDLIDPGTQQPFALIDLGKSMNYEYAPLRSTASQRYQRQDALITAPVEERYRG